jgi:formiminoglutamase
MNSSTNMSIWTGRVDADEGPRALRWHQAVKPVASATKPGIALLGFACDEGVRRNQGRTGARKGPQAIRQMLAGMALHQTCPIYDAGDVECVGEKLEQAHADYAGRVSALLRDGHFPVGLGGGHEIAFGTFIGLADFLKSKQPAPLRVGIVNLDAHFDLRSAAQPNSGTSFLRMADYCRTNGMPYRYCCLGISEPGNTAALFDRASELGAVWCTDNELNAAQLPSALRVFREFAADVDFIYLTICLDVLPASVAPGVSAPAARGVPLDVIETLVDEVKQTGKLAAADVAEMNPDFDQDNRTAKAAARLIYQITR